MPRAFSETNKETIRKTLMQKGREMFIRYGLKKTNIDDLTRAAGIAKGSFYKFFDSKESLFMAIHEESEACLQSDMIGKLDELTDPEEKLRLFFKASFEYIDTDPLLRSVFTGGEFDHLSGIFTTNYFKEHYDHDIAFLEDLIKHWQAQGIIRPLDPAVASRMISSVYFTVLQKEALGDEMYLKVIDMLIDSLISFLKAAGENNEK